MSCNDSVKNENKENIVLDIDITKQQLIDDQENPLNEQQQSTNNNLIIDEQQLKYQIHNDDYIEYVINIIKKTVKCEDILIRQILYSTLSSYIEDDPINLGIIAPTSEGKTYPVEECIKFFPRDDVLKVGSMSAKVLVRDKGILVDRNLNPIEDKVIELRKRLKQLSKTNLREEKEQINAEIENLYKEAKTLIDLRGKILVFLEPPKKDVWDILKPILSHDSEEIEFPFVNQTDRIGHQTKNIVVKGWPSCIFCSARDESKWEIWPEVKSRFLISSPNMIPQKYKESTKLISQKIGKPNLIQQEIIISDKEIDNAKKCILLLKQKINGLKLVNKSGKISVWIPYAELLEKELPSNKGTDVRFQKRVFSLLKIIPIIKSNHRKFLVLGKETSVIADILDLKDVLLMTQNYEGIPKYKIVFYNEIFYPCYQSKDGPDSSSDGMKIEEIKAVTTKQLCEFFKEKKGKPISTDNLKKVYLNELLNNGFIDSVDSKINGRQDIYYPLIEPYNENTDNNKSKNGEPLSFSSNLEQFDNFSQQTFKIYERIIRNITETWLFSEIVRLLSHRVEMNEIREPLADYLNNNDELQLFNNNTNCSSHQKIEEQQSIGLKDNRKESRFTSQKECCCNIINYNTNDSNRLSIRQFTKKYTNISSNQFENQISQNIAPFGKIPLVTSNLVKFDKRDIDNKDTDD